MIALEQIPKPPKNSSFYPTKIDTVILPHPYCITPKHIEYSNGILDEISIERAERMGARCGICVKDFNNKILSYKEHESLVTLFIAVPQNKDLNLIEGLHDYLLEIKEMNLEIDGFAFPKINIE